MNAVNEAVIAAKETIKRWPEPELTVKAAADVATESMKTIVQKTHTLEDAARLLGDLLQVP